MSDYFRNSGLGGLGNLSHKLKLEEEVKKQLELMNPEHKAANEKTSEELTGEQKFLILYYLGFGEDIKLNTKKAVLFSLFLDLTKNSIRPMFSDITRYETEANLNAVVDFFRLIKHNEKAREIEDKLDRLKKRK